MYESKGILQIDLDKSNRYATHLQNRLLKGVNALVTIDQIEANSLSMAQATLTVSEAELEGSCVSLGASSAPDADALETQK
jgi:hypothetical protein